jgi:nitrate/nitrite transport system ATP-binding protein
MNHDPEFKNLRNQIIEQLLSYGEKTHATVSRKLVLPDIEPEDLTHGGPTQFGRRRPPRRRSEIKEEKIEVTA